jgi:WD40 repeat protein
LDSDDNYILASGSRDRLIHIYSSGVDYDEVNNLEGHSSSIIAVKFAFDPDETDPTKRLKLLSLGADKTISYRGVEDPKNINVYHKECEKINKITSMEVQEDKVIAGFDK